MGVRRAILLVDHGSRLPEANAQLEQVADRLRRLLAARGDPAPVHVAHLEIAEPDFAAGIEACLVHGPREIVVHPYFLSEGRHGTRDIPERVEAARRRHPDVQFSVTAVLGAAGTLADAVLARIDELPAEDAGGPARE